ncbi:hypothetical protein RM553_02820 [Zunongwangia sp. F363]|uniref:Secreted protein n=1 Tax=Autumnicola tepida TaxID=3075595 RepID=A0ABU3C6R6_9FLAO|nr:hypothetical protein [Zunongwangia sp. F363]MDT0641755.1 hypothetical protein [Zunongwangia sp. F363]
MKKAILFLMLAGFFVSAQSQEQIIELEETEVKMNSVPLTSNFSSGEAEFIIDEGYTMQFHHNALEFVKKNFDIQEFIEKYGHKGSDSYEVTFRSRKGLLQTVYDSEGNMLSSYQKFKNVALPYEVRNEIYRQYQGWDVIKNKFVAKGKMDNIDKGFYKIQVQKGSKKETFKLPLTETSLAGLASN